MAQTIKLKRSSVAGNIPSTSDLALGEVAINTADGKMYIKKSVDGTDSIIDLSDSPQDAILQEYQFTASANQTTFSGADDNNDTLYYTAGAVQIFLNGILLDSGVDYTATTTTSIVLAETVDANDYLQVFAFKQKISGGSVTVNTFTGNGSTTAFTLSVNPGDENNTRVFIDGVYQSKSNYSVSATTLTFTTAPPTGTAIEVESGNRDVALDTTTNLDFPDSVKLRLGTSQDLQLYHDGSNSHIKNTGSLYVASETSGDLYLRSDDDIFIQPQGGENGITLTGDGAVTLYHNNVQKFFTTSTGVTVTGNIANTSGNLTLDVAGDINLNAGGSDISLQSAGAEYGKFNLTGNNLNIHSSINNADILFKGQDGGSTITALTLDMSSAGEAIFNSDIRLFDSKAVRFGTDQDFRISNDGNHTTLQNSTSNQDILFKGNDDGTPITALTLDMSNAGKATFSGIVNSALGFERGDMFITQNEIDVSSGNLTLDVAGDIILDADGGDILLKDGGTHWASVYTNGTNTYIQNMVNSGDVYLSGKDGSGNGVNALILDMGAAGAATFNDSVTADSLTVDNITIDGNDISTTNSNGNLTITPNGTGNVNINSDTVAITAAENESASLILASDEADDNPDLWRFRNNTDNTLTVGNQISGSSVDHITITPNATVTNSIAAFAGKITAAGSVTANKYIMTGGSQIGQDYAYLKSDSTTTASLTLRKDSTGADSIDFLQLRSDGNGLIGKIEGDGDISFKTATFSGSVTSTGLTVGNSNIGSNTSHLANLTINNNGYIGSANATQALQIATSGAATFSGSVIAQTLTATNGSLYLDDNGSHNGIINAPATLFINIDSDNNSTGEDFIIAKDRTATSGGTELFRIDSSGNVGIGEVSPDAKLDIRSSGTSTYPLLIKSSDDQQLFRFREESDSRGTFYINDASEGSKVTLASDGNSSFMGGNVGIGIDTPSHKLHVKNDNDYAAKFGGTGGGDYSIEIGQGTTNSSAGFNATGSGGSMLFKVQDAEYMRIKPDGKVGIGTNNPGHKLEVAGTALVENAKLKAIAESNSDTALDVFVYDTSKDSDGGAWRHRTQHTSWYTETLNTSTRGATKKFPAVAVIVAESNQITIYDGDDPDMPMWMVFNSSDGSNYTGNHFQMEGSCSVSATAALNGTVCITQNSGTYPTALIEFGFIHDRSKLWTSTGHKYSITPIQKRNVTGSYPSGWESGGLVNNKSNDVAMTVLPTAPIDADTGLPVPTIAVATDVGVSVIKDDGSVVDITVNNASYTHAHKVDFLNDNSLGMSIGVTNGIAQESYYIFNSIPTTDNVITVDNIAGTTQNVDEFYAIQHPNTLVNLQIKGLDTNRKLSASTGNIFGSNEGLSIIDRKVGAPDKGMVAYIASDYNTGWMVGDIKLATLSDTDTTNISASGNTNLLSGGWINNGSFPYETFTTSGLNITSAINTTAYGAANKAWTATAGKTYTAYFNLTLNSGTAPTLFVQTSSSFGNGVSYQTVNGANSFTFTATMSTSSYFSFSISNGVATNFSVANLELYEGGVADRSVNGSSGGLSVFGTVTKTAVATGADLVAYSGFTSSNYLKQPYNSDLDFGTGDFSYSFWHSCSFTTPDRIWMSHGQYNTDGSGLSILQHNSSGPGDRIWIYVGTSSNSSHGYTSVDSVEELGFQQWVITRRSGVLYVYRNGKLEGSVANTANVNLSSKTINELYLGVGREASAVFAYGAGPLALFRVSATAPTAEQIAKMYNDEKHLFQENAKATLYGSSDAVTALAYDDDTELLHAGTSAGRSEFQGLRRVNNTTDAVGAAISASNGFIVED